MILFYKIHIEGGKVGLQFFCMENDIIIIIQE